MAVFRVEKNELKRKLCEWMEENCYFDPEDDDEEVEPEPEEESAPEEDFTVGELVAMCYADVAVIAKEEQEYIIVYVKQF